MEPEDADIRDASSAAPSAGAADVNDPSSSYNNWDAVYASLQDAVANPPRNLQGESSYVYEWLGNPDAGVMLVYNPELDSEEDDAPPTTIILLLHVFGDGAMVGICLNADCPPSSRAILPIALEDVPLRYGGDRDVETVIGIYATPDRRNDEPPINMQGLSHVIGANAVLTQVLAGHIDKENLMLYAGMKYWPSGCLEAEIAEETWIPVMATNNFVFDIPPQALYRRIMRELELL